MAPYRVLRFLCLFFPAIAMAAEDAAFLQGQIIQTLGWQNGRSNERDFRSGYTGNIQYVLEKGTQGKVEKTKTLASGSVGLYIKILTNPHRDEHVWVYWDKEPTRRTLELVDDKGRRTQEPPRATLAVAKDPTPATRTLAERAPEPRAVVAQAQPAPLQAILQQAQRAEGAEAHAAEVQLPRVAEPAPVVEQRAVIRFADAGSAELQRVTTTPAQNSTILPDDLRPQGLRNICGVMGKMCMNNGVRQYLAPTAESQSNDPEIKALADKIVREAGASHDPVQITKAIHDWVAANVPYDTDAYNLWLKDKSNLSGYPVDAKTVMNRLFRSGAKPKGTICSGQANLVTALLRAADVPAVTVEGMTRDTSYGRLLEALSARTGRSVQSIQAGVDRYTQSNYWTDLSAVLSGTTGVELKQVKLLAERADIETPLVCPKAPFQASGREHAWNLIWLNGKWMPMDVTWDSNSYMKPDQSAAGPEGVTHTFDVGAPSWATEASHKQCSPMPASTTTATATAATGATSRQATYDGSIAN